MLKDVGEATEKFGGKILCAAYYVSYRALIRKIKNSGFDCGAAKLTLVLLSRQVFKNPVQSVDFNCSVFI